jgi:hypothetical protein
MKRNHYENRCLCEEMILTGVQLGSSDGTKIMINDGSDLYQEEGEGGKEPLLK